MEKIGEKQKKSDALSCARKIRYRKKRSAENALEAMLVKLPAKDTLYLRSYHCSACGGWHLGNNRHPQGKLGGQHGKSGN